MEANSRRLTVLLALLLPACLLPAQGPGYLGRHTLLGGDVHFFPSLSNLLDPEGASGLNGHAGLVLEQVIGRRLSLGASLHYAPTRMTYSYDSVAGVALMRGWTAGLRLRSYTFRRRGNIAPMGPYQQIELRYLGYRITDYDRRFYADGRSDLGFHSDWVLLAGLGTQRMAGERLCWRAGLQAGWVMNPRPNRSDPQEQYLRDRATDRWRGFWIINPEFGVSVLLW
ncbi:MAG: hypothetical protein OHK0039_38550 [Bacteroidia bacterium]